MTIAFSLLVSTYASQDLSYLNGDFDTQANDGPSLDTRTVTERGLFLPLTLAKKEEIKILAALGAVGLLLAFDQPIMDFVQDHKTELTTQIANAGDFMGSKHFLPPLIVGTMGVGLVFKNEKLKKAAFRSLKSAAVSGLVTEALKSLTHRKRPNKDEGPYVFEGADWVSHNTSFPSGHSTGAWSVATVFATEFKDIKWVPWVSYSLAAITSWSRVHDNKHWASDVVLGALIGYITGKLFTHSLDGNGRITVSPDFSQGLGIRVHVKGKTPSNPLEDKSDPLFP